MEFARENKMNKLDRATILLLISALLAYLAIDVPPQENIWLAVFTILAGICETINLVYTE
jgi:hypothetical protein